MYEISPDGSDRIPADDLGAYLYDIGSSPYFQFEVEIEQAENPSSMAAFASLQVERYVLLRSKIEHSFTGLDSSYDDVVTPSPSWVYNGPVDMTFERKMQDAAVVFISAPVQLYFIDPDNPLSYAAPHAYTLLGFAYRFYITPSSVHRIDSNTSNNSAQLTFMKR